MITDYRHTAEKLQRRIDEVASYVYRDRVPISDWRVHRGDLADAEDPALDDSSWEVFRPSEPIEVPFWLRARVRVPQRFAGKPIALYLRMEGVEHSLFGTETLVYVDGRLVQGTDAYHPEIHLTDDSDDLVVRFYEAYNQRGGVSLGFGAPVAEAFECNLLEEDRRRVEVDGDRVAFYVTPYQVRTAAMRLV